MKGDLRDRLLAALESEGRPSSDYDLNTAVILPENRRLRPAAVLIPIIDRPNGAHIILTKRAPTLKHHPGQVAFPGGKVESFDADATAAALREAHEEIGLQPTNNDVLGTLPPHETVTGFQVEPVLSLIKDGFDTVVDRGEVAEVFEIPLAHVLNRRNFTVQSRRWRGERRYYFTVPWGPYYIWGATARMLHALADRMANDDTDQS